MFFQKEQETMKRKDLQALQLERLKHTVNLCYDSVEFYRGKFDKIGLKPRHIQTLADIKNIPITTKDDFRESYPYGLLAVPMDRIVRLHASSGTTGKPVVVGYTARDLDIWSDVVARFLISCGASEKDIAQISFGYGLFTGALGLHMGFEKIGATVVPVSSGNTERQIMLMKDLRVTSLISTPSYGLYIGESLQKMGVDKSELALKRGFFGAEASTKETHDTLKKMFGIVTNDNYGLTEVMGPGVASECYVQDGMHIAEDHFLAEIVDRDTFEPLSEGEVGELLLTTITKEGMPVLRYRTKDLTSLTYEVCKCGRTGARMRKLTGRTDDMLIIRGVNVFPGQIEAVLFADPAVGGSYEIVVGRQGSQDFLEVKVEITDGTLLTDYAKLELLRQQLHAKLKSALGIGVTVKLCEPMSLKRFEGKAKRVTDLRS